MLHSPVTLVRLTQQGVKRFISPQACSSGIGRCGECADVGHLLQCVLSLSCLVEQFSIDQLLCHSLKHGEWLVEVHLYDMKCHNLGLCIK